MNTTIRQAESVDISAVIDLQKRWMAEGIAHGLIEGAAEEFIRLLNHTNTSPGRASLCKLRAGMPWHVESLELLLAHGSTHVKLDLSGLPGRTHSGCPDDGDAFTGAFYFKDHRVGGRTTLDLPLPAVGE